MVTPIPDRWYAARDGREVTEQFISGPPGTGPRPAPGRATSFAGNRKAVMIIYGHDRQANDALFAWLRAIGLQPGEWSQLIRASGSASPFIGEVLDKALRDVQAVIAFFTPDEYVTAAGARQDRGRLQAPPNVLIEAGMALITHPTRTIIAVLGDQELPSDLAGRHYVRLAIPMSNRSTTLPVASATPAATSTCPEVTGSIPVDFPIAVAPLRPPRRVRPVRTARREVRPDRSAARTQPVIAMPRIWPQDRLPAQRQPPNHRTPQSKCGRARQLSAPRKTPRPAR